MQGGGQLWEHTAHGAQISQEAQEQAVTPHEKRSQEEPGLGQPIRCRPGPIQPEPKASGQRTLSGEKQAHILTLWGYLTGWREHGTQPFGQTKRNRKNKETCMHESKVLSL